MQLYTKGLSQGVVMRSLLFLLYINNIHACTLYTAGLLLTLSQTR